MALANSVDPEETPHDEASKKGLTSLKTSMTNAQAAAISKSEAAVVSVMTNVYFAAQHTLVSSLVPDLNRLVQPSSMTFELTATRHMNTAPVYWNFKLYGRRSEE
ncbi:hypothetical protein DPMN_140200 [Dreissena polymorpha]|uniref:Uncharacterized protein n=1 Tax=Dreissena polymorpha TaxID=45954 RepID=A0A9D4GA10_DREPO|nr:hypothetical protein DPMN_140200 [Dreissena polymorpha]